MSISSTGAGGSWTGTGGASTGQLAASCNADADCGGDLTCVLPSDDDPVFGGGAPGGFCTKPCSADADCDNAHAVCYGAGPSQPGRCTLACALGPGIGNGDGLFTPLGTKCRGRDDVRCTQAANAVATAPAVCLPTCGEDAQCAGSYCDPRTAVCTATPSTGTATGTACDPSQTTGACAGVCVGFDTGVAICSEPCVLGALGGDALQSPNCGGPYQGLCAFHPKANGPGDTGFCTPSCKAQGDCENPNFWCFGVPTLTAELHVGYCFAATASAARTRRPTRARRRRRPPARLPRDEAPAPARRAG